MWFAIGEKNCGLQKISHMYLYVFLHIHDPHELPTFYVSLVYKPNFIIHNVSGYFRTIQNSKFKIQNSSFNVNGYQIINLVCKPWRFLLTIKLWWWWVGSSAQRTDSVRAPHCSTARPSGRAHRWNRMCDCVVTVLPPIHQAKGPCFGKVHVLIQLLPNILL